MKSSANQPSARYEASAAVTPFPTRPVESRQGESRHGASVHEVTPATEGMADGQVDAADHGGSFIRIEPMKALIAVAVLAVLGIGAWIATSNPSMPAAAAPAPSA